LYSWKATVLDSDLIAVMLKYLMLLPPAIIQAIEVSLSPSPVLCYPAREPA